MVALPLCKADIVLGVSRPFPHDPHFPTPIDPRRRLKLGADGGDGHRGSGQNRAAGAVNYVVFPGIGRRTQTDLAVLAVSHIGIAGATNHGAAARGKGNVVGTAVGPTPGYREVIAGAN